MKSATAIAFDYRFSRWLTLAIAVVSLLAIGSIFSSGAPVWAKTGLSLAMAGWAGWTISPLRRPLIVRAAWLPGGHWRVVDADGREFTAELVGGVARGPWIVLNLRRSDGKRLALILGPDNCDTDIRRHLRVRLADAEMRA